LKNSLQRHYVATLRVSRLQRAKEVIEQPMQQTITDDLEALVVTLPLDIHDAVNRLDNRSELLEIVMDLGRLPEGRFP